MKVLKIINWVRGFHILFNRRVDPLIVAESRRLSSTVGRNSEGVTDYVVAIVQRLGVKGLAVSLLLGF